MWHPTVQSVGAAGVGDVVGHGPADIDELAGSDDDPQTGDLRRDADDRRGPGRAADRRRLGLLPGRLDLAIADDGLVDLEPAVDDVQKHGLARDQVERRPAGTSSPWR